MNYNVLEENAARLVAHIFESPHQVHYPYHNLIHTKAVAGHAKEIGMFYSVAEMDLCIISIGAWFHDIGQLYGDMQDHEERGRKIMSDYLKKTEASAEFIESVGNCIKATKSGANPKTLPEKIICDADTFHFGTPLFRETEFLVEKEMEIRTGEKFPHWHEASLQLLKNHIFYTEYCQLLLNQGKKENIEWLELLISS